jgi:hypothetical protein
MENTEHVTLRDITIENTGEVGIEIKGGHHNLIAGPILRNGLARGASISGGHHNGITGCDVYGLNVAYIGAQWWSMNNVVRHNFVHHLIEPGGHPVSPFRNDDGGAGLKIHGNVFYRPGRCAGQFAGPANELTNNIALDMSVFWWTNKRPIDAAGIKKCWNDLSKFGRDLPQGDKGDFIHIMERRIGEKGWLKSPWKDEFPEIAKFIEINPFARTLCNVDLNYACNIRELFHIHGGDGTVQGMESKETGRFRDLPKEGVFKYPEPIKLSDFQDVRSLDFRFKPGFKPMPGFQPIPFQKIGLEHSEFRPNPPDKTSCRRAVYNKFKNGKGGRYDPKLVNARYPVPAYLQ